MIRLAFQEDLIGDNLENLLRRVKASDMVCGKGDGSPDRA